MWTVVISVTCCSFCPIPTAAVNVLPCLCSDKYTSRICGCTFRNFPLTRSPRKVKEYVDVWDLWCKLTDHQMICNYINVRSHHVDVRHWLMVLTWPIWILPAVTEIACFPHLARCHLCFLSLTRCKVNMMLYIAF